ncbi:SAM-dependent methyltransferase [Streptacidiphilus pinicola]|uniref:SAM-dependent methyltransferase n=1 Tax=Streptacidiphilus pinicola TaxID=2219663 RepID=A0A2X0IFS8_9ACTN|nr:class I SAM-dependent methyltransferase [Streptacidiphilus pinicola]RAG83894.1 SAM-dependent methyltransferase [Streptacidiphilus pinicola]
MDWHAWHEEYERDDSSLGRRLRVVQERIREALDGCAPGPITAVSLCAGEGRDLIGVLASGHPRAGDVRARLVELDARNAEVARQAAAGAGLPNVEVVVGDASLTRHYDGMTPADLVLVCGVFGNISDDDVKRTVDHCTELCRPGGTLIWTRNRRKPDLVPQICTWLEERGFLRIWVSEPDAGFGVGVHRFAGEPRPLSLGAQMFTFVR